MVSRPEDAIVLPPFLEDAYAQAKVFCRLLSKRANTGFFRTMLLRRMGGTMEAGRLTVARILDGWGDPGQVPERVRARIMVPVPGVELPRFRGHEPRVVTPSGRAMHVQSTRNLRHENTPIVSTVTREQCLAEDRSNRRIAVVGGDVEHPVFDRID